MISSFINSDKCSLTLRCTAPLHHHGREAKVLTTPTAGRSVIPWHHKQPGGRPREPPAAQRLLRHEHRCKESAIWPAGAASSELVSASNAFGVGGMQSILLWLAQVAEGVLDLDDYDTLAFRVRGDGRKYIASLRTENWMVDAQSQDVWQAFLFARCPKLCCRRCPPTVLTLSM